jgi:hypothetical protein
MQGKGQKAEGKGKQPIGRRQRAEGRNLLLRLLFLSLHRNIKAALAFRQTSRLVGSLIAGQRAKGNSQSAMVNAIKGSGQ